MKTGDEAGFCTRNLGEHSIHERKGQSFAFEQRRSHTS